MSDWYIHHYWHTTDIVSSFKTEFWNHVDSSEQNPSCPIPIPSCQKTNSKNEKQRNTAESL